MTDMTHNEVQTGGAVPFWAVFKRELALYFRSPVAYAIAFAVLFFLSILFNGYISQANQQAPADAGYIPGLLTFLTFLIAPLLTMRLLAEEQREGTLELLMTLPMNEGHFVLGKFLAAWAYWTVLVLVTLIYHFGWQMVGIPDQGVAFGAYLGAWLYGGTVIAVSMIWSAVTEDQIVAAFLGAATILVLYLADIAAVALAGSDGTAWLAGFVRELGLQAHYGATLASGILRGEDIFYFVGMIIVALFITVRIVEIRRWRS